MSKNIKKAESYFKEEFNCCQSILAAFGPENGLNEDLCLKLGTGFVAGMSYQGKTCGAVTGAYLAISLKNGNNIPNDEIRKEMTYMHIREFNKQFLKEFSSTNCNEILGADVGTEEGMFKISEKELFEKICPSVVKRSAEIIEKIFLNK